MYIYIYILSKQVAKVFLKFHFLKSESFPVMCSEVGSWGDGENACVPCANKEGFAFYSADAWPNSSCLYEAVSQLEGRDGIGYQIWMDMVYIVYIYILCIYTDIQIYGYDYVCRAVASAL